jgi:hypothetical protein
LIVIYSVFSFWINVDSCTERPVTNTCRIRPGRTIRCPVKCCGRRTKLGQGSATVTDDSTDAVDYSLGLSQRRVGNRRTFSFPATALDLEKNSEILLRVNRCASSTHLSVGRGPSNLSVFVLEFVHYPPLSVKTTLRSFLLIRTFLRHFAVSVPGSSIGVDLMVGHLRAASREPRKSRS